MKLEDIYLASLALGVIFAGLLTLKAFGVISVGWGVVLLPLWLPLALLLGAVAAALLLALIEVTVEAIAHTRRNR